MDAHEIAYYAVRGTDRDPVKDVEEVEKMIEEYAEQRLKAGQHETIVNCTVAELKEIAGKASELRDAEYAINKFHETPENFSIGDIRVVLEAFKNIK